MQPESPVGGVPEFPTLPIALPETGDFCPTAMKVTKFSGFQEALEYFAEHSPNTDFLTYVDEYGDIDGTLTFHNLAVRAKACASMLQAQNCGVGEPVVLLYPPGLDMLLLCWDAC